MDRTDNHGSNMQRKRSIADLSITRYPGIEQESSGRAVDTALSSDRANSSSTFMFRHALGYMMQVTCFYAVAEAAAYMHRSRDVSDTGAAHYGFFGSLDPIQGSEGPSCKR